MQVKDPFLEPIFLEHLISSYTAIERYLQVPDFLLWPYHWHIF